MPLPKLLVTAGLMAANMALTLTKKTEGPRLDDLKFTGGDYGAALPMLWGMRRYPLSIFWAEDLTEVKRQRKTKGGKYNEYTYYGTFAIALAGHEISGLRRLWADKHLVLDLTGAGPVSPFQFTSSSGGGKGGGGAGAGGFNLGDHISIYYGTETQEADPRMQATVESLHGAGSCPAYRGTAYAVIKDLPLEKVGNRIPQCDAEVVSVVTASYPYETFAINDNNLSRLHGATFSPDYSRFMWSSGTYYEIWDVAARARMIAGALPVTTGVQGPLGLFNNGSFLAIDSTSDYLYQFSADGLSYTTFAGSFSPTGQGGVQVIADGAGNEHWLTYPYSSIRTYRVDGTAFDPLVVTGNDWAPSQFFADTLGNIWAVGRVAIGASTTAHFLRVVTHDGSTGPAYVQATGLGSGGGFRGACCTPDGKFALAWEVDSAADRIYRIDPADGSVLGSTIATLDSYNVKKQFANLQPGSSSIWLEGTEYSLVDLSIIRTINFNDWTTQPATGNIYDPVNHAIITSPSSAAEITWRYLDRIANPGVTLSTIAGDVADMVGIITYAFSDLNQTVTGWSATQGQASNILEPLLDAYDSDIRPHDFTIQGLKRTGVSGGTLETPWFVAKDSRYTVKIKQGNELARAVTVNFADVDADQQPNNVRSSRPLDATGAKGEKTIDLATLAISADSARGLADRKFRRDWNERREVSLSLTAQQLKLEPGDVRTLDLDGESADYRLVSLTVQADDVLATEWVYDHPSLAVIDTAAGAAFDGRDESTIAIPLLSKGFVLDIPLLSDLDDATNPPVYLAAGPYASGTWPGASFFEEVGGEYTDEIAAIPATSQATWGYATDALADVNSAWCWDRGNSVTVYLQNGTLTGCAEADIDENPALNLCLLGDEILNFTTATLIATNTYTLSGFKRGRKGTEQHTGGHAARDVFLLLDTAVAEDIALSDVGTNLSIKAVTQGRTESGAFPIDLAPFTGASLKPLSPVHLKATISGSDWVLTWTRRTRIGGAWTGGTSIPLGETTELYEVEIMDGATVKRAVTGLSSATCTYTSAQQTTDFGAPLSSAPTFRVYQISASVDRGFVAQSA